ncbi:zinc finger protein 551-like [Labrus mixtus]|uniref:zinc finger protein 551-like n=1 Tax=Labrus mixtus TaxID=508554 RepID=UPI0029BFB81A|nr:zinc finger protein 551-like [Labrus mixtus]
MQEQRPDSPGPSCEEQRPDSPGPSCEEQRPDSPGPSCGEQKPDSPGPSCVSMKSDWSIGRYIDFKDGRPADGRVQQESSEVHTDQPDQQNLTDLDSIFMLLEENIVTFVKNELKRVQRGLSPDYPECLESQSEDEDQGRSCKEDFMKITLHFLRRMKQEELADCLQSRTFGAVQQKLKSNLKTKFQCVFEGIAKAGNPTLLKQIYTELYITEGGTGEVNDEHEVRQIETASRKPHRPETTIRQEDIFKASPGRDEPIRTVMTKGVAGIGKTVLTQKFTLDWAEDKDNQGIQFTFPFTFRELNVLKEKKFSLVELVHHFFTETKEAGICRFEEFQVVFIFDGLDECRLPLDFKNNETLTDVTESTSVDVLLTNLIRGNLLPSARLWITTRPAAANQIPPECVDMVTEVRGFTDPQKNESSRRYEEELHRQRKLLDVILTPEIKLQRTDVQQLLVSKEELPPEQQEWSHILDQEDTKPQHIKEEHEELWISQEEEQLQGLEEADTTKFPFTPVSVKSEDDEEKPQSSQLHQRQTEQMETGVDGEDCGEAEPERDSDPERRLQPETEVETEDSYEPETDDSDDWQETREDLSELNLKNKKLKTGKRPHRCSDCGKRFNKKGHLTSHISVHTGEKPFSCSECGKSFNQKRILIRHMWR